METIMNKSSILTSLALGSLVTLSGCATNNPFSTKPMHDGYQNSSKAKEGSCAAHKMDKKADGSCAGHATTMDKKADAKCGDAKCGADLKKTAKKADGKCGEAKCGGNQ